MSKVVLYDGTCGLCSKSMNFIIKHDQKKQYSFFSLQSQEGQDYLRKYQLKTTDFNTLVLVEKNKAYLKSTAALMIAKNLSSPVKYLYAFRVIPLILRDFTYDLVARNRFLFVKNKECSSSKDEKVNHNV